MRFRPHRLLLPLLYSVVARAGEIPLGVHEVLNSYCLNCHSTKEQKGDLDLEASDIHKEPHIWENVLERIEMGEMPPKKGKKQFCPSQAWEGLTLKRHLLHFGR